MANHTKHGRRALEKRQYEADERQARRNERTANEQIDLLLKRPGNSTREIAKLS